MVLEIVFSLRKNLWRLGQSAKTPPFHGGVTGSTPVGVTTIITVW